MVNHICDNMFYLCSAGIPREFTFEMSNREQFRKENPEFETFKRFSNYSGPYELHGFGRYDRGELKMGSAIDGLNQLRPIWKKIFTANDLEYIDSQYFIFFNDTWSRRELLEKRTHRGSTSSICCDHIFCKTDLPSQL